MKLFKWLFADAPKPEAKTEEKKVAPEKSTWEQARELETEAVAKLREFHKDDVDRYFVEVTVKDGTVYKTEVFEQEFWANANYSYHDLKITHVSTGYASSKECAERFVQNNNNGKLVRFGDYFICPKTITKVRLVKVEEKK